MRPRTANLSPPELRGSRKVEQAESNNTPPFFRLLGYLVGPMLVMLLFGLLLIDMAENKRQQLEVESRELLPLQLEAPE